MGAGMIPLEIAHGPLVDISDGEYPCKVAGFNRTGASLGGDGTHYGMVTDGDAILDTPRGSFPLRRGMFFVLPGPGFVEGFRGRGLIITRLDYEGLFQIGGPIEERGRLRYIDGCSDTLLVCPPVVGDPCLNHLHLPSGTEQTAHTHPTERIGVIVAGYGECRTPDETFPLVPGMGWRIPPGSVHSFFTFERSLDVIAWHPDSDTGPSHDDHPMVNRTYVDDISAAAIEEIRTRE